MPCAYSTRRAPVLCELERKWRTALFVFLTSRTNVPDIRTPEKTSSMSTIRGEYQKEYSRYLKLWEGHPLVMPSFLQHLITQREIAGKRKHWNRCELFTELLRYDHEQDEQYDEVADDYRGDADSGL